MGTTRDDPEENLGYRKESNRQSWGGQVEEEVEDFINIRKEERRWPGLTRTVPGWEQPWLHLLWRG